MEQGLPDRLIAAAAGAVGEDRGETRGRGAAQDRRAQPHRAGRAGRAPGQDAVGEVLPASGGFHRSGDAPDAVTFALSPSEGLRVPVVPLKEIVDRAFAERYGVAAINVVNDLTLEAVLAAAVEQRSPVIVQTSVKTVRSIGAGPAVRHVARADRRDRGAGQPAPGSLPGPGGHQSLPAQGLELGAVRRIRAAGRGEPAADHRGGGRGAVLRRERRRRDRVDHRGRGRHRL